MELGNPWEPEQVVLGWPMAGREERKAKPAEAVVQSEESVGVGERPAHGG